MGMHQTYEQQSHHETTTKQHLFLSFIAKTLHCDT